MERDTKANNEVLDCLSARHMSFITALRRKRTEAVYHQVLGFCIVTDSVISLSKRLILVSGINSIKFKYHLTFKFL